MFDSDASVLDPSLILDAAAETTLSVNLLEARKLEIACAWADANSFITDDRSLPGTERIVAFGGEGTPAVADRRSRRLLRAAVLALGWVGTPGAVGFASALVASAALAAPSGGCVTGLCVETPPQADSDSPVRTSITTSCLTEVLCITWVDHVHALETPTRRNRVEEGRATHVPVRCEISA